VVPCNQPVACVVMPQKRTLDAFFAPSSKKPKTEQPTVNETQQEESTPQSINTYRQSLFSTHKHYPFPIPELPEALKKEIQSFPCRPGREINDQPDLDLLYFEPYVPPSSARQLFKFLRSELPFYRVEYNINRYGKDTHVRTPRWTTVFGLDETARFDDQGIPVDALTKTKITDSNYAKYPPRPIPECLDILRRNAEQATDCKFNFCLVNYYASGADSITYHSDDERFLGANPAIASFSFGAQRDFVMKHKPIQGETAPEKPLKLPLASGDMILMRGKTQSKWLHSIPKRSGKNQNDGGRINITFRRAMVKGGTENYYNYNVGTGPVYKWDGTAREMKVIAEK
ncbi:hypothetical protein Golomagni_06750, partial [Golovinomyces magnicellulatus]